MADEPKLMDLLGVSLALGVSDRTVRRLVDGGKVPKPMRIGHSLRWAPKTINDWIAAGCPKDFQPVNA